MLRVVIDTREQRPWAFPPDQVVASVGTLRTGDYALAGDAKFAIERKSLNDFLGTISSGWERFLRELGRMEGSGFVARLVIVEADFESVVFRLGPGGEPIPPAHNHPNLSPQFVAKRVAQLAMMGVTVLFAGRSEYAAALAVAVLRERAHGLRAEQN